MFRFITINLDKTSISVWERLSESCRSLRIFLENFTTWTVYDALTRELLLQIPERRRDCDIILGFRIKNMQASAFSNNMLPFDRFSAEERKKCWNLGTAKETQPHVLLKYFI